MKRGQGHNEKASVHKERPGKERQSTVSALSRGLSASERLLLIEEINISQSLATSTNVLSSLTPASELWPASSLKVRMKTHTHKLKSRVQFQELILKNCRVKTALKRDKRIH